jgi:hypothetical protein
VSVLLFAGSTVAPPPPQPRPPLPAPPHGVYTVLPWEPPHTRDYLRADAWSITLPGLPFVPGGSSNHPAQDRFLSWFFMRYPSDWQQKWLEQNQRNGYTHAIVSPPDDASQGFSLQQQIDAYGRIKAAGLYVHVMLASKLYQPRDMTVDAFVNYAFPLMDALTSAGVVDEFCPAWEMDLFNVPGPTTLNICKEIGKRGHATGQSCWLHFSTHVTSWFADGDPRGRYGFWSDLGGDVDGLDYQGDSAWGAPEWQARIVDTLHQFGEQGDQHKMRAFERFGTLLFDNPTPTEDDANLDGYLACCTYDDVKHTDAKVWGTAEGLRALDGSPI